MAGPDRGDGERQTDPARDRGADVRRLGGRGERRVELGRAALRRLGGPLRQAPRGLLYRDRDRNRRSRRPRKGSGAGAPPPGSSGGGAAGGFGAAGRLAGVLRRRRPSSAGGAPVSGAGGVFGSSRPVTGSRGRPAMTRLPCVIRASLLMVVLAARGTGILLRGVGPGGPVRSTSRIAWSARSRSGMVAAPVAATAGAIAGGTARRGAIERAAAALTAPRRVAR